MMKTTQEYLQLLHIFMYEKAKKYGISRMGIFGSVARGEQKEGSDIDIYFEGTPSGIFALVHLKNELEELLGCKVDIVRLREHMNSILRKRIEKDGIYV